MMDNNKSLLLAVLTGLVLSAAVVDVQTKPHCGKEEKHKEKDCLADTSWIFSFDLVNSGTPVQLLGSIHFERHGGVWGEDSGDIGQIGFLATTFVGQWKKIGKRKYKFFETNVFSVSDQANPGFTIPVLRLKLEVTFELSKDCKCLTSCEGFANFYQLCDWELSCPVNTIPVVMNGRKVGFKNPPCVGLPNPPPCTPPCAVLVS